MRTLFLAVALFIVVLATGCPKGRPVQPAVVARVAQYEVNQLNDNLTAYDCAIFGETIETVSSVSDNSDEKTTCVNATPDLEKAKRIRDATVHRLIRTIDYVYFQFENDLYVKRSSASFLSDITEIGANFAATITNGERAKTVINAAIIGFRGGRQSGSIHFFQEQTAGALISSMQASRNKVLLEMLTRLRDENVDVYSLDEALGDTIKYFYAGTLPRALQELQQNASQSAAASKEAVRVLKGFAPSTPATTEAARTAVDALDVLRQLQMASKSGETDSIRTKALAQLQNIVERINGDSGLVAEINATPNLKAILAALNDKKQTTTGDDYARRVFDLRRLAFDEKTLKPDSISKLNVIIISAGQQ